MADEQEGKLQYASREQARTIDHLDDPVDGHLLILPGEIEPPFWPPLVEEISLLRDSC